MMECLCVSSTISFRQMPSEWCQAFFQCGPSLSHLSTITYSESLDVCQSNLKWMSFWIQVAKKKKPVCSCLFKSVPALHLLYVMHMPFCVNGEGKISQLSHSFNGTAEVEKCWWEIVLLRKANEVILCT